MRKIALDLRQVKADVGVRTRFFHYRRVITAYSVVFLLFSILLNANWYAVLNGDKSVFATNFSANVFMLVFYCLLAVGGVLFLYSVYVLCLIKLTQRALFVIGGTFCLTFAAVACFVPAILATAGHGFNLLAQMRQVLFAGQANDFVAGATAFILLFDVLMLAAVLYAYVHEKREWDATRQNSCKIITVISYNY